MPLFLRMFSITISDTELNRFLAVSTGASFRDALIEVSKVRPDEAPPEP